MVGCAVARVLVSALGPDRFRVDLQLRGHGLSRIGDNGNTGCTSCVTAQLMLNKGTASVVEEGGMRLYVGPGDLLPTETRRAGGAGSGGVLGLGLEVDDRAGVQRGVSVNFWCGEELLVHGGAFHKGAFLGFGRILDLDVEVGFKGVLLAVHRRDLGPLGLVVVGGGPVALFVLDTEFGQGGAYVLLGHLLNKIQTR